MKPPPSPLNYKYVLFCSAQSTTSAPAPVSASLLVSAPHAEGVICPGVYVAPVRAPARDCPSGLDTGSRSSGGPRGQ